MTATPIRKAAQPIKHRGVIFGYHYTAFPTGEGAKCSRQEAQLWWDDELKKCVHCKELTHWRRPHKRGAATHPECEGSVFDTVSEELFADIVFNIAQELGVCEMTDITDAPAEQRPVNRPLGDPNAGCSICGRGYSALWIIARLWTCPLHSLIPIKYRRRWS